MLNHDLSILKWKFSACRSQGFLAQAANISVIF